MTVCVCIASRGRTDLLKETVTKLLAISELPDTKIVIGLDSDDDAPLPELPLDRTIVSVAEREDSLGAKYNRCAAQFDASLYVLWADDIIITTQGWDRKLKEAEDLFTDGIGVVYFGEIPGTLQTGIAVTKGFAEKMGFFCPPYFPFWWHDTWIDEVGRMAGRIVHADVKAELLQDLKGKSRGVREIAWWANFFEKSRSWRRDVATRIIEEGGDLPFRKIQQRQLIPSLEKLLRDRNSRCVDPGTAAQFERHYSFDAPPDERYSRIKSAAIELIPEMKSIA